MTNQGNNEVAGKACRILSVDALRGFDMFWILGAQGLFSALYLLTGMAIFKELAKQMLHSPWHGITAYDVIFPLFIFLSGVSIGLAAKPLADYPVQQRRKKVTHAFRRLLLLLFLGVIYNHGWSSGIPAALDEIRFASVLGRIGIAWFTAMMLVWFLSHRGQYLAAIILLLGYWLLLSRVGVAGFGAGDYSQAGALNVWFDQNLLPGSTYQGLAVDPEGILSNITSVVNALIGVFAGRHIKAWQGQAKKLLTHLVLAALVLLIAGFGWGLVFPVNKTLWTSSFVLVTSGFSLLLLCVFYGVIDVLKIQQWGAFFAVIGSNALLIYLATSLVNWNYSVQSLFGGLVKAAPTSWQVLLQLVFMLLLQWLLLLFLYRRKIFVKV
ncbi:transmembrane glucosamine N-acetyltransferase NagX [Thalassomonas haliotis]|uniref:DUF5009 domain-containing protein n=1 Tax=Thalassomonas haliotis TaxID=485448 RepID=A0ABY7V8A6_9GAMM|nr:DUF5009 domain-containing protein [Thalassomonas haliotis]WDE09858.1 DUF5009 domain-containing protein [Thalassomonas haliotis]